MNVCFIGKHIYPKDIFSNEQDLKTWRSMAIYFDELFVMASSPDLLFHFGKENNIRIYLIPRLGYIGFINCSVFGGIYLNLRYGVDVFDASEIIGGGIAVTILKFLTGKPTVAEVQGEVFRKVQHIESPRSRMLKKIGRFVMNRASRVRVISHAIFNQVKEQGIPESKIRLISLRVDLTLFHPKSDFGWKGDKVGITIGYIGRLVEGKGLEDLFETVKILKNQSLSGFTRFMEARELRIWRLVIYGTGSLEAKLKKMVEDLGIDEKIEWRGFVPYPKVPKALSQVDIFVYPSWHEGFGRSIMEALAMEKAVVATNVGGITDLIKDGENGFLVEPRHPDALALRIKELMQDKNLREKFGKAGRKWVSENYEWNEGIKKFANLFLELKQ